MTPEERRELAERLDQMAARNERTAKEIGALGYGWANGAADLRAAAAALREDLETPMTGPAAYRKKPVDTEPTIRFLVEELLLPLGGCSEGRSYTGPELMLLMDDLRQHVIEVRAERDAAQAEVARLREILPTVDQLGTARAIVRGDGPIDQLLARVEVARVLLDTKGDTDG